jgi:hypothetical protein
MAPLLILALAGLAVSACLGVRSLRRLKSWNRTHGTLAHGDRSIWHGKDPGLVVDFRTATHVRHQFSPWPVPTSWLRRRGEVPVLYDPDDGNRAALGGFFGLWLPPLIAAGIGVLFVVLAILHATGGPPPEDAAAVSLLTAAGACPGSGA